MIDRWLKYLSFEKVAQDGHWRRLQPNQEGKDQSGAPVSGKTWVRKSRLKGFVKLYPHQESFMKKIRKMPERGGVIAAHGTGTGKTVSAIAAFESLKEQGKARRVLVIAPAGLRDNFLNKGVRKFTGSQGIIVSSPGQDPGEEVEYVITSYSAFRKDPNAFIDAYNPDVIIADEFHRAGNPQGKTHQALREARKRVPKFIGLTASIVQNRPEEIVPLVNIARGEEGGSVGTKKQFTRRHVQKRKSPQRGVFGGPTYERTLVRKKQIEKLLGGTIHYIEDLDASKKPPKETKTVAVTMSKEQLALYRMSMRGVDPKVLDKIKRGEEVPDREVMNVFKKLIRARQVSNSIHTVKDMTLEEAAKRTPKIVKILGDVEEHIKTTPDAQIIIYTNVIKGGVDVLEAGLKQRGIPYGKFVGKGQKGVTEETRQQAVNDYIDGKNKVILITGAGAEGLSLGNTTLVMLADGHYNPERVAQAEARGIRAGGQAHRAPEKRKVEVRKYVSTIPRNFWQKITFRPAEKSVEEFVNLTAERKRRLNKQLREVLEQRSKREEEGTVLGKLFGA